MRNPDRIHARRLLVAMLVLSALASPIGLRGRDAPIPDERAALVKELIVPLESTEPSSHRSEDLETLSLWLEGAEVVGLGERHHGTHELHRLAHRIFAHLVEADGFSVLALEINQVHASRLNEYVLGLRDDLEELLAERWWPAEIFYDSALEDLLKWMRRHNAVNKKPVHIAGFDFKQPSFAMTELAARLRRVAPDGAAQVEALYAGIPRHGFGVFPNVHGFTGTLAVRLPEGEAIESLEVGAWIRSSAVSHGSAGLAVRFDDGWESETRSLESAELGFEWEPLEVRPRIPSRPEVLNIDVFHRGNGTVWFGGLVVDLNGQRLQLRGPLSELRIRPLLMPSIQVMDYTYLVDEDVTFEGSASLRVNCSSAVDEILSAVRQADRLLARQIELHRGSLEASETAWMKQLSRLVVQSAEWRR